MNVKTVRWIDKHLGRPICFFLTLYRKIHDLFVKKKVVNRDCAGILFIKLIEQGSTILAYSAFKKAAGMAGKENTYFMTFKENRPAMDILEIIPPSNVIEIDPRTPASFITSAIKALIKIRQLKIDAVIDMEFFARASAILAFLSGADKRVGLHIFAGEGPYRGDLFTHRLIYNPHRHTKESFLNLAKALNHVPPANNAPMSFETTGTNDDSPRFDPSDDMKNLLKKKVEDLTSSPLNGPVIIFNPNTGDLLPSRKWPEENFIKLGEMISADFPRAKILITGTLREKEKADNMASRITNAVSLAGRTTLKELLTLYHISDILVTNDSGPALFSTLTPINSIILFGPETPFLYGAPGKTAGIIASTLACSPCANVYNHRKALCDIGTCMTTIKAETVYGKVKSILETKKQL
ncbi:MAG: glycosyltransferase family 9 protein [Candidatus Omnitrophota bacterium]